MSGPQLGSAAVSAQTPGVIPGDRVVGRGDARLPGPSAPQDDGWGGSGKPEAGVTPKAKDEPSVLLLFLFCTKLNRVAVFDLTKMSSTCINRTHGCWENI